MRERARARKEARQLESEKAPYSLRKLSLAAEVVPRMRRSCAAQLISCRLDQFPSIGNFSFCLKDGSHFYKSVRLLLRLRLQFWLWLLLMMLLWLLLMLLLMPWATLLPWPRAAEVAAAGLLPAI